MFEIKEIKNIVEQIAELRQLPEDVLWTAIESALGAAYKREYTKNDQLIRARISRETGEMQFFQAKQVISESDILPDDEKHQGEEDTRVRFNNERHILLEDAKLVSAGAEQGGEILFPLEPKEDFGRIAAQSARQAITYSINQAERSIAVDEFKGKEGTLIYGPVQRMERGNLFIDIGRTVAILPFSEQIRGERYRQGDTVRAYILSVDDSKKKHGFVQLSRTAPQFVTELFMLEVPELKEGTLIVKNIVRDPGVRSKLAIETIDPAIDPVGSFVGQRGVRVMAVKTELRGEQIDIIPWSDDKAEFVNEALSPAETLDVQLNTDTNTAHVKVSQNQIPVAIGRSGQNLRLAAQLTNTKIIIVDENGEEVAGMDENGEIFISYSRGDGSQSSDDTNKTVGAEEAENASSDETETAEEKAKEAETPAEGVTEDAPKEEAVTEKTEE